MLVVGPDGASSRADVDALARAAARALDQAGIPKHEPVGLVASNGSSFLAAFLACLRLEHPAVLLDPGMTEGEIGRVSVRLGLAAVVRAIVDHPRDVRDFAVAPRHGATSRTAIDGTIVKLTSGSTGEPRGVVTSSEALIADDEALRSVMEIGVQDRIVAMVPFSHAYGLGSLVAPALFAGITLLVPRRGSPFEPLRVAAHAGGTVFPTVPAWVAAMVRLSEPPAWPASIRTVITAGAPLLPASAAEFRTRFGRAIHVLYGASECGGITYDREGGAGERGTVGEPIPGVRVELLHADEAGGAGQIVARSAAVARGYFPERHESLGGGRFVSQDLALLVGGELRLVGRLDQVINIKGLKVHPSEIERAIAELDGVEDVVVDGVSDGQHGEPVVRAIVACSLGTLEPDQVIAWCRHRLSDHKVPRRVLVVRSLPRNARAKLDRAALESLDHV